MTHRNYASVPKTGLFGRSREHATVAGQQIRGQEKLIPGNAFKVKEAATSRWGKLIDLRRFPGRRLLYGTEEMWHPTTRKATKVDQFLQKRWFSLP
jgi:hypothetical protein